MGVFKKLKDVLFDIDDEEDIPVITKEEPKEENPIKEVKMPVEEETEKVEEKPKKESTFNFPLDDFDDDELPTRTKREYVVEEKPKPREVRRFEEPVRRKEPDYTPRYHQTSSISRREEPRQQFKLSPVISPVYGILDQNYTKEDIIVKTESTNKRPDLESVRQKAYGEKRVEIEEVEDEFSEPLKTLDEILVEREETPVKEKKVIEEVKEEPIFEEEIPRSSEPKEEDFDKTIESDLFDLIDSMYDDRDEGDEE